MDLMQIARLIRHHVWLIAVVSLITGAAAYAGSYLFTPQYVSTASVLVRPKASTILSSSGAPAAAQPSMVDATSAKSIEETHASLVSSRAVAIGVVQQLSLDKRPTDTRFLQSLVRNLKQVVTVVKSYVIHGAYVEPSKFEGAVQQTQHNLTGTPIKDSYLIEIKAIADDPNLAASIAQAATDQLIKVSQDRSKRDSEANLKLLTAQLDQARTDYESTEQALLTFEQQNGLTDTTSTLHVTATSQQDLINQLRQDGVDVAAAQAQEKSIEDQIRHISSTDSATSTVANGRSTTTVTNVSANPVYDSLVSERGLLDGQIAGLQAKQAALNALLAPAAGLPPPQEAKLRDLQLEESTASDNYRLLSTSYQGALVNNGTDEAELIQADKPGVPLYPDRPIRYLYAIIGLLVGIGGGLLLASIHERRRAAVPASQTRAA
jgi:uncharacterized protein involved in exopolysaccharide biosynthesis